MQGNNVAKQTIYVLTIKLSTITIMCYKIYLKYNQSIYNDILLTMVIFLFHKLVYFVSMFSFRIFQDIAYC